MKKKVLSALLTTAMLASMLVGCGSSNEAPAASTDAAPAASTEAKTEAPASTEAAEPAAAEVEEAPEVEDNGEDALVYEVSTNGEAKGEIVEE